MCDCPDDQAGNMEFDSSSCRRRVLQHRSAISQARELPKTASEEFCKEHGILTTANPLHHLIFDETEQVPYDVRHSEIKGMVGHILVLFKDALRPRAIQELDWRLTASDLYGDWPRLQSFDRLKKWIFSEYKKFALIAPGLLRTWLTKDCFKRTKWEEIQGNIGPLKDPAAEVLALFVSLADGISTLYDTTANPEDVQRKCKLYRVKMIEIWRARAVFPTSHLVDHIKEDLERCGGVYQIDVDAWERKHKDSKLEARFTSHRNLEAEIMVNTTYRMGWQYLLRGGLNASVGQDLLATMRDPSLKRIFHPGTDVDAVAARAREIGIDTVEVCKPHGVIRESKLSDSQQRDLILAYKRTYDIDVKELKHVTVLEHKSFIKEGVTTSIGFSYKIMQDDTTAYARLQDVWLHKRNGDDLGVVWVNLRWYFKTGNLDGESQQEILRIKDRSPFDDSRWLPVQPASALIREAAISHACQYATDRLDVCKAANQQPKRKNFVVIEHCSDNKDYLLNHYVERVVS
jgi:hypothetical protein